MFMMKPSHTFYTKDQTSFYTTDSRHTGFYGRRFCGLDIATNYPDVCFVCVILFYLILSRISEKKKLTKIVCYYILGPAFFGRQPTEYLKEGGVVPPLARRGP